MSDSKPGGPAAGTVAEGGRKNPRLQHEVLVSITSSQGTFSGWGTNLSAGGVFVNAPDAAVATAKAGAGVDLLLQLPGQAECKLKGRIAWARANGPEVAEPGMGIEFVEPDAATRELIVRMMARLAADLA